MANGPSSGFSSVEPEQINRDGEKWGKELKDAGIKTNQIRNLYSAVQHIRVRASQPEVNQAYINRRLIFLKPKLAYASGRQTKLKPLREFLVQVIDRVVGEEQDPPKARENFFILMESIVAYHKFYGGD